MPCHAMPCHAMPCHAMPTLDAPPSVALFGRRHCAALHCTALHCAALQCAALQCAVAKRSRPPPTDHSTEALVRALRRIQWHRRTAMGRYSRSKKTNKQTQSMATQSVRTETSGMCAAAYAHSCAINAPRLYHESIATHSTPWVRPSHAELVRARQCIACAHAVPLRRFRAIRWKGECLQHGVATLEPFELLQRSTAAQSQHLLLQLGPLQLQPVQSEERARSATE
jgi:hypothetical protein